MKKVIRYTFGLATLLIIIQVLVILPFRQQLNIHSLPPNFKKGIYHVHSTFSDGQGDIEEITGAAAANKLDFVILNDHGRPNLDSLQATRWLNEVLLIGGSEFSLNSGHLATMGYRPPNYLFPPEPQEAIDEVDRLGGCTFLAHPFDDRIPWREWDVKNFTGIEILSGYQEFRRAGLLKIIRFPFQYLLNPEYAMTSLLHQPTKELGLWDRLNRQGKFWAIYAIDAHGRLPLTRKINLFFPSYRSLFKIMTVYVRIERELDRNPQLSAATITSGLKNGNFFNCLESLASANGFEINYVSSEGRRWEMGQPTTEMPGQIALKLPFEFQTNVYIKRNGALFYKAEKNSRKNLTVPVTQSGVYRAEIYLASGPFTHLPWILTNPLLIGLKENPSPSTALPPVKRILFDKEGYFQIEKNEASQAELSETVTARGECQARLQFKLRPQNNDDPNFWVALARREKLNLANSLGLRFDTRSSERLLFWAQVRTGSGKAENFYRHSFAADREWQTVSLPFSGLTKIQGGENRPAWDNVTSIFFLIDSTLSFAEKTGWLELKNVGVF